jgi:hypothetical protein
LSLVENSASQLIVIIFSSNWQPNLLHFFVGLLKLHFNSLIFVARHCFLRSLIFFNSLSLFIATSLCNLAHPGVLVSPWTHHHLVKGRSSSQLYWEVELVEHCNDFKRKLYFHPKKMFFGDVAFEIWIENKPYISVMKKM